jgi:hypothetical protein
VENLLGGFLKLLASEKDLNVNVEVTIRFEK